jgi:hypothetical protein
VVLLVLLLVLVLVLVVLLLLLPQVPLGLLLLTTKDPQQ